MTAAVAAHQPAEFVILAGGPHPTAYVSREGPRGYAPRLVISNDITPPTISITSPVDLASSPSAKTTITGVAGTAPGDSSTVTVQIYAGRGHRGRAAPDDHDEGLEDRDVLGHDGRAPGAGEYTRPSRSPTPTGTCRRPTARFYVGGP